VARVLIRIPARDFDPSDGRGQLECTAAARSYVTFATPDGLPGHADDMMLTGERVLDVWGFIPGLRRLVSWAG